MNWHFSSFVWVEIFGGFIGTEEHKTVLIGAVSLLTVGNV